MRDASPWFPIDARLGPLLRAVRSPELPEFSYPSGRVKGRDVREKDRRGEGEEGEGTFVEQISPLDGDITLESSTNVAFP